MQETEGDGAADTEDEHEGQLTDEPAAHAGFADDEGFGEVVAATVGDEREEGEETASPSRIKRWRG